MAGPMKPDELGQYQAKYIPEGVFEVFNKAIATGWSGYSATLKQEEIMTAIIEKMGMSADDRSLIFDRGWLNIEEAYRNAGWKVVYDKPGYNESYGANWVFTKTK